MKQLLICSLLLFSGLIGASAPLAKPYSEFITPENNATENIKPIGYSPYLIQEQHFQEMRGYPYPAGYNTADPLKPYGMSAKDITDRMKRSQSDLLP